MPIYEYECSKCGHSMEAIQKFSDPALTECPACHTENLHKKVSAAAFHLKGGGWYVTDFKDKSKPKEETTKTDNTKAKEADKTESKTTAGETAPAAKKSEPATND